MTQPKLFIFDVDDVICELKKAIYLALKTDHGIDIHHDGWYDFNLAKVYGITAEQVFDSFTKHDILRGGELNPHIFEVLDYLKHNNIETMALTARGWHAEGNAITQAFFEEHSIGIPTIKVVGHGDSKAKIIAAMHDHQIVGYIDDNARHILETFSDCGDKVGQYFLRTQPWNRHVTPSGNIIRVEEVNHIPKLLEDSLSLGRKNVRLSKNKM